MLLITVINCLSTFDQSSHNLQPNRSFISHTCADSRRKPGDGWRWSGHRRVNSCCRHQLTCLQVWNMQHCLWHPGPLHGSPQFCLHHRHGWVTRVTVLYLQFHQFCVEFDGWSLLVLYSLSCFPSFFLFLNKQACHFKKMIFKTISCIYLNIHGRIYATTLFHSVYVWVRAYMRVCVCVCARACVCVCVWETSD